MYRPLSATRTQRCEIRPCLRMLSASNAAMRSAPVLAWRDGGTLCVCRAGRCGHRPLRLFIGNRCVGAASRTTRAGLALQLLRSCHCEPVTDVTGVAIRPPALRLRWLPFFLRRKKGRKERRQNQGFGILSAAEVLIVSVLSCPANRSVQNSCRAFVSPLRLPPRRTLCVCWLSKRGHILHLPRVAMWASPPTKFYR